MSTFAPGIDQPLSAAEAFGPDNPFFAPSPLPFHAPPFDRIRDEHFQPAIEATMAQQLAEIEAIANSPAPATFENTIVAMERSGQPFQRVMAVFGSITGANTNPTLQALKATLAPKLAAHNDAIVLNQRLFARVEAIYNQHEKQYKDQRESLSLDAEAAHLLQLTYDSFVHSGAKLSEAEKVELRSLNAELSTLSNSFVTKILGATQAGAYLTTDKAALDGLTEARQASAAQAAEARGQQGYLLPLQNTTQQPDLNALTRRDTRQAIFERSWNRAELGDENDTRATVARIAHLRARKAALLGYPNFAAWKLEDQMAGTPEAAIKFLDALVPAVTARAAREANDIQAVINQQNKNSCDGGFELKPWDWEFYAEQVRKARYDLDEAVVKPYFELDSVLRNGVFFSATQLYGITFQERHDLPAYAPDMRVFEVFNDDGSHLALFYTDYFKRDNKNGGAWMSSFLSQSRLLGTQPVIINVCNYSKPAPGEPALLTFDEVTTLFHEFGHALHGMFSDVQHPSVGGTATPRDFVEFPSQFNEHWATEPSVFTNYAKHYKTGESMPEELAAKLRKAATFNKGYDMTELVAAAELDMQWHTLPADAPEQDPGEFERQALTRTGLNIPYVPPRYRSTYFSHIWGGGYSASYYAYLWTQMLDEDAWQWFVDHGGMTRANGDRFRKMILSRGNAQDLAKLYEDWRGAPPNAEAMLHNRGLESTPEKP